jgi:calcineurin-like phosphoesterase family protein
MGQVFVISDLHLGHAATLSFLRRDGSPLRPFLNLHEMHDRIIDGWNSVVTAQDKIYVLGDVSMKTNKMLQGLLADLPGKKRLIRGNHDLGKDSWYHGAGFKSIYGVRNINNVWLTHVPMHPQSMEGRAIGNIHGHLHDKYVVMRGYESQVRNGYSTFPFADMKYFNACVEPLDYIPRTIDSIVEERKWR